MWSTSDAYLEALRSADRSWRSKVEVLWAGQYVAALDVVASGSISVDGVAVRRSATINLIDAHGTLTPSAATDLLAPRGTELRLSRGLDLPSGITEWVPLGVFGVTRPRVSAHNGATTVEIAGKDRVDAIRARRFDAPYPIADGTLTTAAISGIITSRLTAPIRVADVAYTTPEVVYETLSDPWDAIKDLSESGALVTYFDPTGTAVVEPSAPRATGVIYEPGENSVLVSVSREMQAEKTYSGVIVTGEHPDYPGITSELWDMDATSATYSDGPFGRRPYGFSSPLLKTQAQADAAAATIFARVTGMYEQVELTTVGPIGHEIDDVITIRDDDSRTYGDWRITRISVPLRPGEVQLTAERWHW